MVIVFVFKSTSKVRQMQSYNLCFYNITMILPLGGVKVFPNICLEKNNNDKFAVALLGHNQFSTMESILVVIVEYLRLYVPSSQFRPLRQL